MSSPELPSDQNLRKSSPDYNDALANDPLFQNGRSYKLTSSDIPHLLPSPEKLKPNEDRKIGEISTWPAHCSTAQSAELDADCRKPQFLRHLETYLKRELTLLGCTVECSATEESLQAYRDVFKFLTNVFHTYKPLLSLIKLKYEEVIKSQKETILRLEPLKSMVVNITEQCEQRVLHLKKEEKDDLACLQSTNSQLQKHTSSLEEKIAGLNEQVKKCQEEVGLGYRKYREEADSRKLLIQELNDIKYRNVDSKGNNNDGTEDDPVIMKIALRKAREDLATKTYMLAELKSKYGDVVPRRDFEKIGVQCKEMESNLLLLRDDHEKLMTEHSTLLSLHQTLTEEKERSRCFTPRPDWKKWVSHLRGNDWAEVIEKESTSDKVDMLMAHVSGIDLRNVKSSKDDDVFEPKGDAVDIPPFLRSALPVRNLHLNKRELFSIIDDIWREKLKAEGRSLSSNRSNMSEYLRNYLQGRYGSESLAIEWGYNIYDSCEKFSFDPAVKLFVDVLNSEVDEAIYSVRLSHVEKILEALTKCDCDHKDWITVEEFQQCLASQYPGLSLVDMYHVVSMVEVDGTVYYKGIFKQDDGNNGTFVSFLHEVFERDKRKLLASIAERLEDKSYIHIEEFTDWLSSVAPNSSLELCQRLIDFVFGVPGNTDQKHDRVNKETLLERVKGSCFLTDTSACMSK